MLNFPESIKSLIYIFDPTYKEIFKKVIDELNYYTSQWCACKKNFIKKFIKNHYLNDKLIELFINTNFKNSHREVKNQVSYHNQVFKAVNKIQYGEDDWWDYVRNVGELDEYYISDFFKNKTYNKILKYNHNEFKVSK
jgi:hypothetical protein